MKKKKQIPSQQDIIYYRTETGLVNKAGFQLDLFIARYNNYNVLLLKLIITTKNNKMKLISSLQYLISLENDNIYL